MIPNTPHLPPIPIPFEFSSDNYIRINSCQSNSGTSREEASTTSRTPTLTQRFRVHRNQTLPRGSQALPRPRGEAHQEYSPLSQPRLPRHHRLRKSTPLAIQGCIVHSRSSSNQYFNFHYMYGGFKRWVVDRYLVGSLYRNGFRVMWFPAILYFICTTVATQSAATT